MLLSKQKSHRGWVKLLCSLNLSSPEIDSGLDSLWCLCPVKQSWSFSTHMCELASHSEDFLRVVRAASEHRPLCFCMWLRLVLQETAWTVSGELSVVGSGLSCGPNVLCVAHSGEPGPLQAQVPWAAPLESCHSASCSSLLEEWQIWIQIPEGVSAGTFRFWVDVFWKSWYLFATMEIVF